MAEELKKLSSEELKELREQLKREALESRQSKINKENDDTDNSFGGKKITVILSEDKMTASIVLSAPPIGEVYTVPEIIGELRKNKVVYGFKSSEIMDFISDESYDVPFVVARGTEMEKGADGYYEFKVDMSTHRKPEIREDGSVDYSAMGRLANVAAGDVIAVYHPAIQGKKGVNVIGAELIPKFAKDQSPLRGKSIEYDEETLEYKATISGKISCNNNNVEILTVHEVQGDVDMSIGKLEFYGDLIINGNVEQGVTIRAGRNVTITGTVSGARIMAGGDVILNKGIQGNNRGKISARGNVFAEFIEYAKVDAIGEVHANYILNSEVTAQSKVFASGSRGAIIGGNTHALMGIEMVNAGNESEPKTTLHVGLTPDDYQKYMNLLGSQKSYMGQVEKVVEEISRLLNKGKQVGVTKEEKEHIFNLRGIKDEIYLRLDEIEKDKKALGTKMSMGANASIIVHKTVHINAIIGIDAVTVRITKEDYGVRYVNKNDNIERRTISI